MALIQGGGSLCDLLAKQWFIAQWIPSVTMEKSWTPIDSHCKNFNTLIFSSHTWNIVKNCPSQIFSACRSEGVDYWVWFPIDERHWPLEAFCQNFPRGCWRGLTHALQDHFVTFHNISSKEYNWKRKRSFCHWNDLCEMLISLDFQQVLLCWFMSKRFTIEIFWLAFIEALKIISSNTWCSFIDRFQLQFYWIQKKNNCKRLMLWRKSKLQLLRNCSTSTWTT